MASERAYSVLVAEDELFQRLALLEFMSLCEFEAVAVENGKLALDELKNPENDFDLLLLDLAMPEMDGFELLTHMKSDEKLSQIPVVVMSANESQTIVSQCLQLGATDYLVKPVRIQECKALTNKMRKRQVTPEQASNLTGLAKYDNMRPIGKGAAGAVSVCRNIIDNEEYAIKEIDLQYLSEKDKKSAQNEVQFLKVLKGPTIVRFHESFVHKNSIHIVMEYASGGNLAQLINKKLVSGIRFSTHEVLCNLSQVVMAVMAMHNKNILHRDIKTQNIFITKSGILKLGDFGISRELETMNAKAQTCCGTPYFMPPEVCLGKPYDSKADVWAVGVILYELVTLQKPFESDTINGVLHKIVKCAYDPLPDNIDPQIKMLVVALLNKDYNKRPSIFEVANIPCVNKEIQQFIVKNQIQDEVAEISDFINNTSAEEQQEYNKDDGEEENKETDREESGGVATYLLEALEDWAEIMRADIKIQDYKNGWFGKHLRCCQGEEIFEWLLDRAEPDQKKTRLICQKMLEQGIIQNVENKQYFGLNDLYRFYYDSDEIADNLIRKWKEETHEAFEVAVGLVQKIEELYEKAIVEDSEVEGHTIDVDAALKSTEYKSYINAACELAQVSIEELNDTERMAFFLNVYQCMYIHYFLRMVNEGKVVSSSNSYMSKLKNYAFDYSSKPFYYNIGGHNYDLDDIKQGMFRGNQRKPGSLLRQLSANDEKCKFLPTQMCMDPRINFVCLDFPTFVEHVDVFQGKDEEEYFQCLETFVGEIINAKVSIDTMQGEICLPQLMKTYLEDFGGNEQALIEFVFRFIDSPSIELEEAIQEVCVKKQMWIRYE